uniref:Protein KTI12 homolog n=1 Tax=Oncorhynchus tshawytscha TaxID=74940 RepID=A0AAZ3QQ24_ONCTS
NVSRDDTEQDSEPELPGEVIEPLPTASSTRYAVPKGPNDISRSREEGPVQLCLKTFPRTQHGTRKRAFSSSWYSQNEKNVRGSLRAEAERRINKEDIVILDSLNYIKGYRYELFCLIKHTQTPHCLVYCLTSAEVSSTWNTERDVEEQYTQEILDALVLRFETPDSRNRWDSPLFTIQKEDTLPFEAISDAIFKRKAPPPNQSTQSQPLSSTNFLYELDKVTQDVLMAILNSQKTSVPGDLIAVPGATEKISFATFCVLLTYTPLLLKCIIYLTVSHGHILFILITTSHSLAPTGVNVILYQITGSLSMGLWINGHPSKSIFHLMQLVAQPLSHQKGIAIKHIGCLRQGPNHWKHGDWLLSGFRSRLRNQYFVVPPAAHFEQHSTGKVVLVES